MGVTLCPAIPNTQSCPRAERRDENNRKSTIENLKSLHPYPMFLPAYKAAFGGFLSFFPLLLNCSPVQLLSPGVVPPPPNSTLKTQNSKLNFFCLFTFDFSSPPIPRERTGDPTWSPLPARNKRRTQSLFSPPPNSKLNTQN